MKKVIVSTSLAVLIGLLVALPLNAQMAGTGRDKVTNQTEDIGLLILVDRMNLSPEQMQKLHDALTTVLDQADALKTLASSFKQALISFHGDKDQLNALIESYQSKLHDALASLREKMQSEFNSLKGELTIEQGELLRKALIPATPRMGMMGERSGWMSRSPQLPPQQGFFGQRPMGGNSPREFQPMHPETGFAGAHPLLERGEELLTRVAKLAKVLELKLQAAAS